MNGTEGVRGVHGVFTCGCGRSDVVMAAVGKIRTVAVSKYLIFVKVQSVSSPRALAVVIWMFLLLGEVM